MERRIRTISERSAGRAISPAPTLLAVLLLVTIVPGGAAYAVLERDMALRTTLRDVPRRDEARELSVRAVSGLAAAITRSVERQVAPLPVERACVVWIPGFEASSGVSEASRASVSGRVRLALLNLPPPRG